MTTSIVCEWTGQALQPTGRFKQSCRDRFKSGERYAIQEIQQRSWKSHQHFFAQLEEMWLSLPEEYAQEFPTSEHLRKWCLIKAGYCHIEKIVTKCKADAIEFAAFAKKLNSYAVIDVNDCVVTAYTARSQAMKGENAMTAQEFQESKTKVLDIISGILEDDKVN